MKIYTKRGDAGQTSLYRGGQLQKDSPRMAVCGAVDELNSYLGWVRAQGLPAWMEEHLRRVQSDLFLLGADLAAPAEGVKEGDRVLRLEEGSESFLEEAIDRMDAALEPLRQFIIPGGTAAAAALHVARSVCRRAEREVVALSRKETVSPPTLAYLNRLSDLLFTMAREANQIAGVDDLPWNKGDKGRQD